MLDDSPITVTIPADQLGHALGAVRSQLKRRERALANSDFVPTPGRLNLNKVKIGKLRDAENTLDAALQKYLADRDNTHEKAGAELSPAGHFE